MKIKMIVKPKEKSGIASWEEDIPAYLNHKHAPDIEEFGAVDRALKTIEWFNSTLRPGESPREIVGFMVDGKFVETETARKFAEEAGI